MAARRGTVLEKVLTRAEVMPASMRSLVPRVRSYRIDVKSSRLFEISHMWRVTSPSFLNYRLTTLVKGNSKRTHSLIRPLFGPLNEDRIVKSRLARDRGPDEEE